MHRRAAKRIVAARRVALLGRLTGMHQSDDMAELMDQHRRNVTKGFVRADQSGPSMVLGVQVDVCFDDLPFPPQHLFVLNIGLTCSVG